MSIKIYPITLFALFLTGCKVGPIYQEPKLEIHFEWHADTASGFDNCSTEDWVWWQQLQDPMLNELIKDAASQNLDLKIAAVRVIQAREEAKGKKGDIYPHIDASVNYDHVYYSKNALVKGLLGTACPIKHHVRRNVNFYELGFDADWEIDLFGVTSHEIAALKAQEEALQESLCGIWVTLSAEIAKNYVEMRGLQKRVELLKKNIATHREILKLFQELLDRGISNESDYSKMQAEIVTLKAEVPPVEFAINRAMHRIEILLGYTPGDLFERLSEGSTLLDLPETLPIGYPSELLRRRPDIRKAERELAAATERIGSAIASLFPRFSLRGFIGEISTKAGSIFNPSSATWLAGPQVLLPIFNSRLLLQDVEYNKLATQTSIYTYQKTVFEALEESENAIAALQSEKERFAYLKEAYGLYRISYLFAESLFDRGVNDHFELVKSKKALIVAEDLMMQSQVDLLIKYISLYKALGGSWGKDSEM